MASAATLHVDPITFGDMLEREGLDRNADFHAEDAHWGMWMPCSDLPTVGKASIYPATIVNKGNQVRVVVNNYDIGSLAANALPEAVEALSAYGGKQAPAYIYSTGSGRQSDSVYVFKPKGKR
jgi:hypothetical protein